MRWQYTTDQIYPKGIFRLVMDRGKLESCLEERSAEGWELVSAIPNKGYHGGTNCVLLIFKRPI